jgi:hypothetical protein
MMHMVVNVSLGFYLIVCCACPRLLLNVKAYQNENAAKPIIVSDSTIDPYTLIHQRQ